MKPYSNITRISIRVFSVIHIFIFIFFVHSLLAPDNVWLLTDQAKIELFLGILIFCVGGGLFIYSFILLVAKFSQDHWGATIPIVISIVTWVLSIFIMPFLANSFDLSFRLRQTAFEESAKSMIKIQNKTTVDLPPEYSHTSVTGGVYLVDGRVFYMQSIGMMAEYGPGYLYDPSDKPQEVCINFSKLLASPNWYYCDLNWRLLQ